MRGGNPWQLIFLTYLVMILIFAGLLILNWR